MATKVLSEDSRSQWRIVFNPDELDIYLIHVQCGVSLDPLDRMTIEDFLARTPRTMLDQQALATLKLLLLKALT